MTVGQCPWILVYVWRREGDSDRPLLAALGLVILAASGCGHAAPSNKADDDAPRPGDDAAAGAASAAEPPAFPISCAGADVLSVSSVPVAVQSAVSAASPPPAPSLSVTAVTDDVVAIEAIGPVLDQLCSRTVTARASCTADGVALEMTIVQLADQAGGALKNVLWRPVITVRVTPHRRALTAKATWRLRSARGVELDHPATPFFQQRYPISVMTVFSK